MKEMEVDFNNGRRVNKTKYNKIKRLEEKRRQRAVELLELINRRNPSVKICMPARTPPPNIKK